MDSETIKHAIWGSVVALALATIGFLGVGASIDNAKLSQQMTDLDAKAYTACVTVGHWSPTECRAGEYGTR